MKRIIFLFICFLPFLLSAQNKDQRSRSGEPTDAQRQKMEQIIKARIIEVLDLNEETSIKLFTRRNENRKKMGDLFHNREYTINNLERELKSGKKLSSEYYKEQIRKIDEIDNAITMQKAKYTRTLKKILSVEQMAKYHVLNARLMDEINREMEKDKEKSKK